MSFWSELAKGIAADLATDYINKRGADGAIEDIGSLAKGVKNFFSEGNSSNEEGNSLGDVYNHYLQEEDYQGAIDFVKECYNGQTKDYAYFFYIGNAQLQLSQVNNDDNILNKAVQNLKSAYNTCPRNDEDSAFLKEQYENAHSWQNFIKDMRETYAQIEEFISEDRFDEAVKKWNAYYRKHLNNDKDYTYYEKLTEIYLYELISHEDRDMDFRNIDDVLSNMELRALEDEQKEKVKENKDFILLLKTDKKIANYTAEGNYKKSHQAIEDYYSTQWSKTNDIGYWTRLFNNGCLALQNNIILGKNREEDISLLRTALSQRERLDDGSSRETIMNDLKKLEEIINENKSTKAYSETKSANDENEREYIIELKLCYSDGVISDRERRLLDKLRVSLGISEERAKELELQCNPKSLSKEEEEYAEEVKAILEDGIISDRERRLLNRLAKSLNISEERAKEIENLIQP